MGLNDYMEAVHDWESALSVSYKDYKSSYKAEVLSLPADVAAHSNPLTQAQFERAQAAVEAAGPVAFEAFRENATQAMFSGGRIGVGAPDYWTHICTPMESGCANVYGNTSRSLGFTLIAVETFSLPVPLMGNVFVHEGLHQLYPPYGECVVRGIANSWVFPSGQVPMEGCNVQ